MVRDSNPIDAFFASQRYGKVLKLINKGSSGASILDIGCGEDGGLLPHTKGFSQKHGCDRLFHLPRTARGVTYAPVDLESKKPLPYGARQFDCVTCTAVIEHLDRKSAGRVFSEAFRVLKPGSPLVLTTPSPRAMRIMGLLAGARLISKREIDEHKQLFTAKELEKMARGAGFQEVNASSWQLGMNQLVLARKPQVSGRTTSRPATAAKAMR